MTLFDCATHSRGIVLKIGGDPVTHRRLVDMGLLAQEFYVRVKTRQARLTDFDCGFSAVVQSDIANDIQVEIKQ